jgi:uncharacterized protein
MYVPRLTDTLLEQALKAMPGVLVLGPRASGKSTTAQRVVRSVVRLDDPRQARAFRADPDVALKQFAEPVLLDEWQAVPEVLGAVKRAIDEDFRPGRFVLTGSALAGDHASMWPGTGRLATIDMWPMTERELAGGLAGPSFIDRVIDCDFPSAPIDTDLADLVTRVVRGGFPQAALGPPHTTTALLDGYRRQLIQRDMRINAPRRDPIKIARLLDALAAMTAGTVQDHNLIEAAGVTRPTFDQYEMSLSDLRVLDRVPAFASNRLDRLVKTPKRYITDSGLASSILGLDHEGIFRDGDALGRLLDTFVAAQLRPELATRTSEPHMAHLRTEKGVREIDLILDLGTQGLIAIEVKSSNAPTAKHARHLRWFKDETGDRFMHGLVLHSGPMTYQLDDRIHAVPIAALWTP